MNLDDIQIPPPGSYAAHMPLNLQKQQQQSIPLHEQQQKYIGSPILQQQQQQSYSALQQQQAQNYYYQPGINRNYYGQMEQDARYIEQQQQQQQAARYPNNYAAYPSQYQPQSQQAYQEHFQNAATAQMKQQQQLLQQSQVPFLSGNNEYSTLDFQQQQQQQHQMLHQQQQPLTPPTYPLPQYEQPTPNNLDSPIHDTNEDLHSSLKYKPQIQQNPIKQALQQQQLPQIHPLAHEIQYQHGFQQMPGDYQNTNIRLGHYYQPPGDHPLNQFPSPQQQIQTHQQQYLYQRELLISGGDPNEYINVNQHQVASHQNDNNKQISGLNVQRTQSAQYHPSIGLEKGASGEQAHQQQFYQKQYQELQQQQQQQQHQQAQQFHQQQQLLQRGDPSHDSQLSSQLNGNQPSRQQQYQPKQDIDMQSDTKQENISGLPFARTSVSIPLPQSYIRNSHSNEDAGQQRLQKYHQHQIHKATTTTATAAATGSAEHSKKLTAKEQSELKIEKKYKKSSQTNSEIKRIQRNLSHKKKAAEECDAGNAEANAFKKYLQKDMHAGSNSQIEFSKEYQATKKEPESECESEHHDENKDSRNCRNHGDMQSSQSLQHHCCKYDPSEISEAEQSDMMTQSQGSCMMAEEDEKELPDGQEKQQKMKRNEKRLEKQNIIENNPEDSDQQQVRIRAQSSHMHDQKGLKEEELEEAAAGDEGNNKATSKTKTPVDNSKTDEIAILADSIKHCNKKNVVKNIMSAFLTFMNDRHYRIYSEADQSCILSLYHSQQSGAATDEDDKIETIRQKFKRYIAPKSLNHYTVRLLILHPNYGPIFKYFIMNPIHKWINNSKVSDLGAHIKMIGFFLSCFQDPTILEELKRHEKKRAHFS